jgi:hypothetical protein
MDELKEHHNAHAPNNFMQDTPPRADVDEILRRKRKAREYKVRRSMCVTTTRLGREEHYHSQAAVGGAAGLRSLSGLPNWATGPGALKPLALSYNPANTIADLLVLCRLAIHVDSEK